MPEKVLVRGLSWLGDAVLSLPAMEALKRLWPDAALTIVAPQGLAPLWLMQPSVDSVQAFGPARRNGRLMEDLGLAVRLRREKWDVAVVMPNSFRSALLPALAGVPRRVGFSTDGRRLLLTHPVAKSESLRAGHQVEHYMTLVRALGYEDPAPPARLAVSDDLLKWAEEALEDPLRAVPSRPVVGIHPGAAYGLAKRWFPERFLSVAEGAVRELDALVLLLGAEGEASWAAEAASASPGRVIDWTGRTDVAELAALLARCDLLVCNDSGPMHLAAAVGTSVVAIFGSSEPARTGPMGEGHRVLRESIHCSPCFARTCPEEENLYRCFELITVDRVLEAAAESLSVHLAEPLKPLRDRP
jgi:heptosyltransferase-2